MQRVPYDSLDYIDYCMCLNGEPYSGVAFSLYDNGRLEFEVTFRDGIRMGLRRAWFDSGVLSEECTMFKGVLHGKKREWHRNGQLAEEAEYEIGILVRQKCWDEHGGLTEEFQLAGNDPAAKQLELYREAYKEELEADNQQAKDV